MKINGIISTGDFYIPIIKGSILERGLKCEYQKRRWKDGKEED